MTELTRRRTRQKIAPATAAEDAHNSGLGTSPASPISTTDTTEPTSHLPPASSFFAVPNVVLTGVGFHPFGSVLGQRIYNRNTQHVQDGPANKILRSLLTGEDGLLLHVWAILQASVFRHKTIISAIPYFLVAVVFNHARRTLFFGHPTAGFFILSQPDDDWRLLLARPDVFVEDVVKAVKGGKYVQAVLMKGLWDMLAGSVTATLILADDATSCRNMSRALEMFPLKKRDTVAQTLARRIRDIATTLFIVWLFSCIEFAVAQASATVAIVYAVWMMLTVPGKGGPDLLAHILLDTSLLTTMWVALFAWLQVVVLSWKGLVPLVARSLSSPFRRPGVLLALALCVTAMRAVLRYRSRLYIAIETSGLFVFLAYVGISGLLMCANTAAVRSKTGEDGKKESEEAAH